MNEPMRYAGYTFFQESFGPAGAQPGDVMFSQFAVANNGTLVYRPGPALASDTEPVWVDRSGATTPLGVARRA